MMKYYRKFVDVSYTRCITVKVVVSAHSTRIEGQIEEVENNR